MSQLILSQFAIFLNLVIIKDLIYLQSLKSVQKCAKVYISVTFWDLYMAGLYGFSSLSLDTKGRIVIPARYKDLLKEAASGSIIVTRDPQYPSLLIYPGALWKKISDAFENLSGLNPKIRSLQWNFLGNAHSIDFEVSERMTLLIPQSLRKYSQIKEKTKVVLIGMGQKLELWSEKNWKLKEEGKKIQGERLEIELPSEVREIPF